MKKLFLVLFALLPVALATASTIPPPPPLPKPFTTVTPLTFTVNQPAYTAQLPTVQYEYYGNKVQYLKTAYSNISSVTYTTGTAATAVETTTDTAGSYSITPMAVGAVTITIHANVATLYNGGYVMVADTYVFNVTVAPITSSQAVTINVDQWTTIPTPTAETTYTITNNGSADATWSLLTSATPVGVKVFTHSLGTDVVHVFDGKGDEYDYTVTSTLWTPTSGQTILANVSTSQPEYQTLISQRTAAETYATALPFWPYAVRRYWPGGMGAAGTYLNTAASFNYNTSDNVTVLEGTYANYIYLVNPNGSGDEEAPTSSGSTGVAYDPKYGTIYGDPSGNSATLPYSASMAITGSGGALEFANVVSGYLGFNRVTGTNLTVIGVTSGDDAGFGTSWTGYEISYLEVGSLPSEQPPSGVITASKPQVLTKGTVNITWTLN